MQWMYSSYHDGDEEGKSSIPGYPYAIEHLLLGILDNKFTSQTWESLVVANCSGADGAMNT